MNRRLIDRVVLAVARIKGSSFILVNEREGQIDVAATLSVAQNHTLFVPAEDQQGAKQAYTTVINAVLDVKDSKDGAQILRAGAVVEGLFVLMEGSPVTAEQLKGSSFDLARLLFPVARAEIARLLAQARMSDVPVQWDLPRDVDKDAAMAPGTDASSTPSA